MKQISGSKSSRHKRGLKVAGTRGVQKVAGTRGDIIYIYVDVNMLLALKLDQLIRAAARGRHNDGMVRLCVHTRYFQFPSVGSFTCLSIGHCYTSAGNTVL